MKLPLYERVALQIDIPEKGLKKGDLVTTVEFLSARRDLPNAYCVESFNALGETIAVFTVAESDLEALTEHDVLHKRELNIETDTTATWQGGEAEERQSHFFGQVQRREQEYEPFVAANSLPDVAVANEPTKDPLDKVIFEQGLRIKKLFFDTELDLMLVLLTNGRVLNLKLTGFGRLSNATAEQLTDYTLENDGTAVSWESLDEDLSIRGFIKQAALEEIVYHLAKVF